MSSDFSSQQVSFSVIKKNRQPILNKTNYVSFIELFAEFDDNDHLYIVFQSADSYMLMAKYMNIETQFIGLPLFFHSLSERNRNKITMQTSVDNVM